MRSHAGSANEYARAFGIPVISHCEDKHLAAAGVMHEGNVSTELGLAGIPAEAEESMVARDILLAPVVSEKSYSLLDENKYTFIVDPRANKTEIKLALESVFKGIKVDKVNTVRTLGKIKTQGRTSGRTPEIKKAYVMLKEDSKPIEFFEGMV